MALLLRRTSFVKKTAIVFLFLAAFGLLSHLQSEKTNAEHVTCAYITCWNGASAINLGYTCCPYTCFGITHYCAGGPSPTPAPNTPTPPACTPSYFNYCNGSQACTEACCGTCNVSCTSCANGCTNGACNPEPQYYYVGAFVDNGNNVFDNVGLATSPDVPAPWVRFLYNYGGSGSFEYVSGWGGFTIGTVQYFSYDSIPAGYQIINQSGNQSAPFTAGGRYRILLRAIPTATPTVTPTPTPTTIPTLTPRPPRAPQCWVYGDIHPAASGNPVGDGWITENDLTDLQRLVIGLIPMTPEYLKRADLNKTGTLSAADMSAMSNWLNGGTVVWNACPDVTANVYFDLDRNGVDDLLPDPPPVTVSLNTNPGVITQATGSTTGMTTFSNLTRYGVQHTLTLSNLPSGTEVVVPPAHPRTFTLTENDQIFNFGLAVIPCSVTMSAASINMTAGSSGYNLAASVTGLSGATVVNMNFSSSNAGVASVNPSIDSTSLYQTIVTPVSAGNASIHAYANLSDGRLCDSTIDTAVTVNAPTPTLTPTPTRTPTPTHTPTLVPCTTSINPLSLTIVRGDPSPQISATVTSGLGSASITNMNFISSSTSIVTVATANDSSSPFQTYLNAGPSSGSTNVRAIATLSDGRTCQTTTATDVNISVVNPTNTPTATPVPVYSFTGNVFNDANDDGVKNPAAGTFPAETAYTASQVRLFLQTTAGVSVSSVYSTLATGNYGFGSVVGGAYNILLPVPPSGYEVSVIPTNVLVSSSMTNQNVGLYRADTCHDGDDDNGNGKIDCDDTLCHLDYNPLNASSCCTPGDTRCDESVPPPPLTPCINSLDDDGDGLIDAGDPDCHLGGNPANPYVPGRNENPAPVCTPGVRTGSPLSANITVNPGASIPIQTAVCQYVDPVLIPTQYTWTRSTSGDSALCEGVGSSIVISSSDTSGSYGTYTAPSCPSSQITCRPRVTVRGNNTDMFSSFNNTTITVRRASAITARVRVVSDGNCAINAGDAFTGSVQLQLNPGGVLNTNTGIATFTCNADTANYTLALGGATGYTIVATRVNGTVNSNPSGNTISINNLNGATDATFCISPNTPWFQVDTGNVRMSTLYNPVPVNRSASKDTTYPGIFYSSAVSSQIPTGRVSTEGWLVSNEYTFGSDTENVNGSLSYDFYKSKVNRDGVNVATFPEQTTTLIDSMIPTSGVYEKNGDLTIGDGTPITISGGKRVVILVNGTATVNSRILIPQGGGVFILAAKNNIIISSSVGLDNPATEYDPSDLATHTLDGYYTAQESITVAGGLCSGFVPDRRVNVGGALIANSLKPFESSGTHKIFNNRSLCGQNLLYPSLFISQRLDFLTQLTDFYKTTQTRWQEVNP